MGDRGWQIPVSVASLVHMEFLAIWGYIVRPYLKKKKKKRHEIGSSLGRWEWILKELGGEASMIKMHYINTCIYVTYILAG